MSYGMLFDVDGVLVDSYRTHYRAWLELCRDRGLTMSEAQFAATFGRTSREVICELWPERAYSADQIREIDETKEAIFRRQLTEPFPPMEGIVGLLRSLAESGFRLGIGSSAPPKNVSLTLECLGCRELFGAIITGADVTRGKPDPEVFLLGARGLGIDPSRCAIIDDAPAGVAAANAAGGQSIGFASTGRTVAQLSHARRVIQGLNELTVEGLRRFIDRSE